MFILDACGIIPDEIANTIGQIYNILLIAVPILIVLFGVIDFVKAVASGKAEDMSKSTSTFVKRLVIGVIVFLILALVKLVTGIIQTDAAQSGASCLNEIFGNSKN